MLVGVDHGVMIRRLPPAGLSKTRRLGVGPKVHVGGVDPTEKGLAGGVLALDPILGGGHDLIIAGLHALLGERAGVLDLLLAYPAPARLLGGVVGIGRPAVHHAARAEAFAKVRKVLRIRVVRQLGFLLGVQVIQVTEKLIEAMGCRQESVQVSEVVLAELAGGVAMVLE